ncbi:MAG: DinB family protein [Thermoflexales bacterium]
MDYRDVIRSQYQAALEMLKQAIAKCPEALWNDPADKMAFWRVAYHALFFTDLYLQTSEKEFIAWEKHRKDYEQMGPPLWAPDQIPQIGEPYTRDEVLEYLELCRKQADTRTRLLDLDAPSGFEWLTFGKFELQFYSIRHIQQHAGELMERLGSRAGIDVNWVGQVRAP